LKINNRQVGGYLKPKGVTMSDKKEVVNLPENEYTLNDEELALAKKIRAKLRNTAKTIIEIGEELINAMEGKPRGFKDPFYSAIGISSRSAQRYMQIANHPDVKQLKLNDELEGKTMTDLLQTITPDTSIKADNIDTKKVANGVYSRYKDKPETLKQIVKELQELIDANS